MPVLLETTQLNGRNVKEEPPRWQDTHQPLLRLRWAVIDFGPGFEGRNVAEGVVEHAHGSGLRKRFGNSGRRLLLHVSVDQSTGPGRETSQLNASTPSRSAEECSWAEEEGADGHRTST